MFRFNLLVCLEIGSLLYATLCRLLNFSYPVSTFSLRWPWIIAVIRMIRRSWNAACTFSRRPLSYGQILERNSILFEPLSINWRGRTRGLCPRVPRCLFDSIIPCWTSSTYCCCTSRTIESSPNSPPSSSYCNWADTSHRRGLRRVDRMPLSRGRLSSPWIISIFWTCCAA